MFNFLKKKKNKETVQENEELTTAEETVEDPKRAKAKAAGVIKDEPTIEQSDDKYLVLEHINKIYDNHVQAVFDFNLVVKKHEFIVFVGPSGCGKSTTLRMIAGLEDITSGNLFIDGVYSNDLTPKDRNIAMVFQSYALFPHMSVYDNIAFGLKIRHYPKEEIDARVHEAAKILQIEEYLDRKPKALSGGQRQRVALGRAIVKKAKVFLMDEPLSNLDAKLRVSMRSEIIKLHEKLEATTVYVTHDQTEAMTMASRIVVMSKGYVQQIGTPSEIYNHPANIFVATFIGAPAMNIIDGMYDNGKITYGDHVIELTKEQIKQHDEFYKNLIVEFNKEISQYKTREEYVAEQKKLNIRLKSEIDEYVDGIMKEKEWKQECLNKFRDYLNIGKHAISFGIRPEHMALESEAKEGHFTDTIEVGVDVAELLGNEYHLHCYWEDKDIIVKAPAVEAFENAKKIKIKIDLDKFHLFDIDTTRAIF